MKKVVLIIISFVLCVSFAGYLSAKVPAGKLDLKYSIKSFQNTEKEILDTLEEYSEELQNLYDEMEALDLDSDSSAADAAALQVMQSDLQEFQASLMSMSDKLKINACKMKCLREYRANGSEMGYQSCVHVCEMSKMSEMMEQSREAQEGILRNIDL